MNIGEKSKNFFTFSNKRKRKRKRGTNFVKNNCLYFYKYPPASSEHFIKIASEVAEFRPVVIKTRKKKKKKGKFRGKQSCGFQTVETITPNPCKNVSLTFIEVLKFFFDITLTKKNLVDEKKKKEREKERKKCIGERLKRAIGGKFFSGNKKWKKIFLDSRNMTGIETDKNEMKVVK